MERWWSSHFYSPQSEAELFAIQDISQEGENHLGIRKKLIRAYIKGFLKCTKVNETKYSKLQLLKAVSLAKSGLSFKEIINRIEE